MDSTILSASKLSRRQVARLHTLLWRGTTLKRLIGKGLQRVLEYGEDCPKSIYWECSEICEALDLRRRHNRGTKAWQQMIERSSYESLKVDDLSMDTFIRDENAYLGWRKVTLNIGDRRAWGCEWQLSWTSFEQRRHEPGNTDIENCNLHKMTFRLKRTRGTTTKTAFQFYFMFSCALEQI